MGGFAGWLSKQDTDLVEPSSLEQVTRKAQTPSAAAHGTSQHTTPPAGPTTRPAQSGVGTGGSSGTGTAGGGPGGGGGSSAAPPFQIRHNPQIPPADPVFARCDRTGPRRRWLPTAQEVQARRPPPRRMPQRVRSSWGGPGAAGGVPNSAPMTRNMSTQKASGWLTDCTDPGPYGVAASSAPEPTSSMSHPARLHQRGPTLPDAEAGHVRTHKNLKFGNWR